MQKKAYKCLAKCMAKYLTMKWGKQQEYIPLSAVRSYEAPSLKQMKEKYIYENKQMHNFCTTGMGYRLLLYL